METFKVQIPSPMLWLFYKVKVTFIVGKIRSEQNTTMTKTSESKLEMLKTLTEIPTAMFQESEKYLDKALYN